MSKKAKISDAVQILRNRYVKDDPERKASVEAERVNAHVARMIYDLRNDAGLTQKELAELVGTTQSVISRLEDADYQGHSLSMLSRIAEALRQKVTVAITTKEPRRTEATVTLTINKAGLRQLQGELAKSIGKAVRSKLPPGSKTRDALAEEIARQATQDLESVLSRMAR
jgi:transcriptional regulator with XRE-family HTH domain